MSKSEFVQELADHLESETTLKMSGGLSATAIDWARFLPYMKKFLAIILELMGP